jgi:hypothetical protein
VWGCVLSTRRLAEYVRATRSGRIRAIPLGVMTSVAVLSLTISFASNNNGSAGAPEALAANTDANIQPENPSLEAVAEPMPLGDVLSASHRRADSSRPAQQQQTVEQPVESPGDDGLVISQPAAVAPGADGEPVALSGVIADDDSSSSHDWSNRGRSGRIPRDRATATATAGSALPPTASATATKVAAIPLVSATPVVHLPTATSTSDVSAQATATMDIGIPDNTTAVPLVTATYTPTSTRTATPTRTNTATATATTAPPTGVPATATPVGGEDLSLALIGSVPADEYSVRADVDGLNGDLRVMFKVDGAPFHPENDPPFENIEPYHLFGENGSQPVLDSLGPGTHTIIAEVYPQNSMTKLAESEPITIGSTANTSTPTPTATTASPSATPTPTGTPVPGATSTPTPQPGAATSTPTRTPTRTATSTPTRTPTPVPPPAPTPTTPPQAGTRDKFKQPFSSTSFWNMPIGSSAQFQWSPITSGINSFWTDEEPISMGGNVLKDAYENGNWPISGACSGRKLPFQVPVPSGLTTHSATDIGNQANFSGAFLKSDGRTLVEAQGLVFRSNCVAMMIERSSHDIYGDGYPAIGGHGGSALSGVAGSLRVWEVQGNDPIRHALKILVSSGDLSASNGGYRWPARNADYGYEGRYNGSNPNLRMGSLLALAPNVNIDNLGLQTEFGRRLAWTYQNYGAYVVDELYGSSWDPHTMTVELGVNAALDARYGSDLEGGAIAQDLKKIMTNLSVVTNNGPSSVGGGGTPKQPLLPPIGN